MNLRAVVVWLIERVHESRGLHRRLFDSPDVLNVQRSRIAACPQRLMVNPLPRAHLCAILHPNYASP